MTKITKLNKSWEDLLLQKPWLPIPKLFVEDVESDMEITKSLELVDSMILQKISEFKKEVLLLIRIPIQVQIWIWQIKLLVVV